MKAFNRPELVKHKTLEEDEKKVPIIHMVLRKVV